MFYQKLARQRQTAQSASCVFPAVLKGPPVQKKEEAFNAFLALLPTEKRKSKSPKVTACLFPSSAQMSNIPAESDVTLISGGGEEKIKFKKKIHIFNDPV